MAKKQVVRYAVYTRDNDLDLTFGVLSIHDTRAEAQKICDQINKKKDNVEAIVENWVD